MRYSQRGTRAHGCAAAERSAGASPGRACVEPERLGARAAGGRASVGGSWAPRGARQAEGPRAGSGRLSSGQASWRQRAVPVVDLVAGDSAPEQQARRAGTVARLVGDTRMLRHLVGVEVLS